MKERGIDGCFSLINYLNRIILFLAFFLVLGVKYTLRPDTNQVYQELVRFDKLILWRLDYTEFEAFHD